MVHWFGGQDRCAISNADYDSIKRFHLGKHYFGEKERFFFKRGKKER
jgi:hypothetical protein